MSKEFFNVRMLKDGRRTVILIDGAEKEQDEAAYAIIQVLYASRFGCAPTPCTTEMDVKETDIEKMEGKERIQAPSHETEEEFERRMKELAPIIEEPEAPSSAPALPDKSSSPLPPSVEEIPQVTGLEPVKPETEIPTDEELGKMVSYEIARRRNNEIMTGGIFEGLTAIEALHQHAEAALAPLNKYAASLPDSDERAYIVKACKQFMATLEPERYEGRDRQIRFIRNIANLTTVSPFIVGYTDLESFLRNAGDEEISNVVTGLAYALRDRSHRK